MNDVIPRWSTWDPALGLRFAAMWRRLAARSAGEHRRACSAEARVWVKYSRCARLGLPL